MLNRKETLLLVVDIQEKLLPAIAGGEKILENTVKFLKIARLLSLPILITEQYPKGLGKTCSPLIEAVGEEKPPILEKISFSCLGEQTIRESVEPYSSIIVCGIECHVCVCQTVLDLLDGEKKVQVMADCTGSRREENCKIGLDRMRHAGTVITSLETAAFELMRTAEIREFKEIIQIIK